jgi:hypothetical protein
MSSPPSISSLLSAQDPREIRPNYGGRCLSDLPDAILNQFGIPNRKSGLIETFLAAGAKPGVFQNTVLLLIDGLGVAQSTEWLLLKELGNAGSVTPITTVFPSTTAAALTTLHSGGSTPQEHALPEWNVYFAEEDAILETLPFRFLHGRRDCAADPRILFDGRTIYERLGEAGVRSFTFVRSAYADSAYSRVSLKGSTVRGFVDITDLFLNLAHDLSSARSPTYFFVYWDGIDAMAHKYGPGGGYARVGLDVFSYAFRQALLDHLDPGIARETLFLLTADHGGVRVKPEETIYLEDVWPDIAEIFRCGPNGKPILPTGNVRDVFLSVRGDQVDAACNSLRQLLGDKATVFASEEALKAGLFGIGAIHPKLKSRIGDILILPCDNHSLWFRHPGTPPFAHRGAHGGLSRKEMIVPLAIAGLSSLL